MHIGIAEDDPDQQALMRLLMQSAGHSVAIFGSVAESIKALKKERFEMLVVDWMLPDGTGVELLHWARGNLGWELPGTFDVELEIRNLSLKLTAK